VGNHSTADWRRRQVEEFVVHQQGREEFVVQRNPPAPDTGS
jgi:hypothetical protein